MLVREVWSHIYDSNPCDICDGLICFPRVLLQRRKTSVLLDATEYIQGLKQKLEELNRLQVATEQKIVDYDPMPKVHTHTHIYIN